MMSYASSHHPNADALLRVRNVLADALGTDRAQTSVMVTNRDPRPGSGLYVSPGTRNPAYMVVEATLPDAILNTEEGQKKLLEQLQALEPLKQNVQLQPPETQAREILDKIKKVAEGTDFNAELLKWPGFDPEVVKKSWNVQKHMVRYRSHGRDKGPYGIEFRLGIPAENEEKSKALEKQVLDVLSKDENKQIFMQNLAKRASKAARKEAEKSGKPLSEAEIAAFEAQILALKVSVNESERWDGGIRISIRSQAQAEAYEKVSSDDRKEPDNARELKNSNVLHTLPDGDKNEALQKALSRSLQDMPALKPFVPLLLGKEDIVNALRKGLTKIKHAGNEKEIQEILASDLFKDQSVHFGDGADSNDAAKPIPDIKIEGQKVTMVLDLESDKMPKFVQDMAALDMPKPFTDRLSAPKDLAAIADKIIAAGEAMKDINWSQREEQKSSEPHYSLGA